MCGGIARLRAANFLFLLNHPNLGLFPTALSDQDDIWLPDKLSRFVAALGRDDELAHSSIRFTIGRFNTEEEVDYAIALLHEKIGKLRALSPLWEMVQEGVDLSTVQWAAH